MAAGEQGFDDARHRRRRNDDAVPARQRRTGDAEQLARGVGDRRAREAVVDAAVEADQPVDGAAEPGLPRAADPVDDAGAREQRTVAGAADGEREVAGADRSAASPIESGCAPGSAAASKR